MSPITNGVNINDDFILLSQPESRVVNELLLSWQPDAVIDVHEAPARKKTLAHEGYLINFEALIGTANNPNVNARIRAFSHTYLLPQWIDQMEAQGIRTQPYIGAISTIAQPITQGRLWLRNLRNKAGILRAFSFLIENQFDNAKPYSSKSKHYTEPYSELVLSIETLIKVLTYRIERQ